MKCSPRVVALVGPLGAGKTALFEAMLFAAKAIPRMGTVRSHDMVGDNSPEAKARAMSVESNLATLDLEGERWSIIDCPGSPELVQETRHALCVADVAVVVVEPDPTRAVAASPILQALDAAKVPHVVFINKVDRAGAGAKLKETLTALQALSARPLVLREIPIRQGDEVTGFVDLVSERAYGFKGQEDALLAKLPESVRAEESAERTTLLETLADYDDHLLEEILEDVPPTADEIEASLRRDLKDDLLVDVFFGSAEGGHGVARMFEALRHEAPSVEETATRLGLLQGTGTLAQAFKTVHAPHVGKLSWTRVWRGEIQDGSTIAGSRVAGIHRPLGTTMKRQGVALAGELVALGHIEDLKTGQGVLEDETIELPWVDVIQPVASISIQTAKRGDDVKLSSALSKLCDEDPSLQIEHNSETHELVLWGQGDMHLRLALDRLVRRFSLDLQTEAPLVPYRETIRRNGASHGRFKHQSGGHGAFGDVHLEIEPTGRGGGFVFEERITGGVVPKQYFPSVERGAREYLKQGPLGFAVVDIKVTLVNGTYHSVDSSDAAFQQATRIALTEGLPLCEPVLLEPVIEIAVAAPSDWTSRVQRMVSARRGGQLLGFDARPGWTGWDVVQARLPQAEMRDLVTELRSLTQGVGTFTWAFHHLQAVEGKEAERVVEMRKKQLADRRG